MDMGHEEAPSYIIKATTSLSVCMVSWPHARSINPLKPVEAMAKGLSGKVRH